MSQKRRKLSERHADKQEQSTSKNIVRNKRRRFWTTEKFLSILALIVSAGTMVTITYQNHLIQKQQYASVMPYLIFHHGDDFDENGDPRCILWVTNEGLGPALINQATYSFGENEYDNFGDLYMSAIYSNYPGINTGRNDEVTKGYLLKTGKDIPIIHSNDSLSAAILHKIISEDLKIDLEYSSLYDEKWEVNNRGNLIPLKVE